MSDTWGEIITTVDRAVDRDGYWVTASAFHGSGKHAICRRYAEMFDDVPALTREAVETLAEALPTTKGAWG